MAGPETRFIVVHLLPYSAAAVHEAAASLVCLLSISLESGGVYLIDGRCGLLATSQCLAKHLEIIFRRTGQESTPQSAPPTAGDGTQQLYC